MTAVVFSYMGGIIHAYYTIALAPAVAALVGIASTQLWRARGNPAAAGTLSAGIGLTALTAYLLLSRRSEWLPGLSIAILVSGLLCALLVFFASRLPDVARRLVAVGALVTVLAGTGAYTVATAAIPHSGALPSAGPDTGGGMRMGGAGGLLGTSLPGDDLAALIRQDSAKYTWAVATVGSNNAAGYQLGSGAPVMAVGGFNGTDPAPTLEQFQQYVRSGRIHYFLGEGMMMRGETGSDAAERIAAWVADTYPPTTVDGVTVYDLSR